MFFYREKLPEAGTIVVACLIDEEDNENCIYVTLPEYNNFRGILYKRELPKRVKHQKKMLTEMKQAGQIVCVVSTTPTFKADGHPELIELSMKGADTKYHPAIITRQKNIEKLLKIVKFVSLQFGYDFVELVKTLQETEIVPLTEIDDTDGVNTYSDLYLNYLRNYNDLLKKMNIEEKGFNDVSELIAGMIKETDASVTLDFDLFVWKADRDAVFVLRDAFDHVTKAYADQSIDLRYLGAPSYQVTFPQIDTKQIDIVLQSVKDSIIEFMTKHKVNGFDLKFELDKKSVKPGDISIAFPYKIEMTQN